MESTIYVPSKPNSRCPAKYLLASFLTVSLTIVILGYLARQRHASAIVTTPTDRPLGEQHLEPVFKVSSQSGDQLNEQSLTQEGMEDLSIQDAPKTELDNVFMQLDTEAPVFFQNTEGRTERNYYDLSSQRVQEADEDHVLLSSEMPTSQLLTEPTNVSDDSQGLGLLGRLWSKIWSDEEQGTVSKEQASLSGNFTTLMDNLSSVLSSTTSKNQTEPGVVTGGLKVIAGKAHSRVTAMLPNLSPAEQRYDNFGNLIEPSPPPTKPATVPPIGNLPPSCDDYPSSYVRDFVSHALHTAGRKERTILQDFERAVKSNPELGIIEIEGGLAMFSLVAASMGRQAVVLEPNHNCAGNLRRMLELNQLSDLVVVKELAVSDQKGFGRFISEGHDENVVIPVPVSDVTLDRLDNHVIVNVVTLDDVLSHVTFQKAILKVPLRRLHPSLFTSATKLFSKIKIHYVFMNWKYEKANEEAAIKTISFLKSQEFEPRSRLENGFGLITAFYRYWPKHVIWVNKFPW